MSANPVSVFQEAIQQLRAMDETDSGPSRSPIPFNDSFVESFENACKEHGLSFPLLYEQLGEPALDGGPRCILRVMDPTSDGCQLYQLRWRVGWNNWASLEERRLFRVWLREAFERAIAQVREQLNSGRAQSRETTAEAVNCAPAGQSEVKAPIKPNGGWMGDVDLAAALSVHPSQIKAFRAKLRRMRDERKLSMEDWQKFENRKRNEPQFLYRANAQAIVKMAERYSLPK